MFGIKILKILKLLVKKNSKNTKHIFIKLMIDNFYNVIFEII